MQRFSSAVLALILACGLFAMPAHAQPGRGNGGGPGQQSVEPADLFSTLQSDPRFSIFADMVQAAGLHNELRNGSGYTVFAPTNIAFQGMTPGELNSMTSASNRAELDVIVRRHLMRRPMRRADAQGRRFFELRTLAGNNTYITINRDDSVYIDGGRIMEFATSRRPMA